MSRKHEQCVINTLLLNFSLPKRNLTYGSEKPLSSMGRRFFPSTSIMVTTLPHICVFSFLAVSPTFIVFRKYCNKSDCERDRARSNLFMINQRQNCHCPVIMIPINTAKAASLRQISKPPPCCLWYCDCEHRCASKKKKNFFRLWEHHCRVCNQKHTCCKQSDKGMCYTPFKFQHLNVWMAGRYDFVAGTLMMVIKCWPSYYNWLCKPHYKNSIGCN